MRDAVTCRQGDNMRVVTRRGAVLFAIPKRVVKNTPLVLDTYLVQARQHILHRLHDRIAALVHIGAEREQPLCVAGGGAKHGGVPLAVVIKPFHELGKLLGAPLGDAKEVRHAKKRKVDERGP